ncbi:LONRF1 isoform 8 [Pan troglodytes]|uniref:LON peptidase N-terminal domain and ring finger 1 n=3 Tax=Homininae TaxID=207598 RepID=E9PRX6_HUMAN|nr:LON peptidase N-terminal domain and ring finger 1 [Homo sapiens]PNI29864.1 LONRF1 isoform 2 [Pan troglodytes]KAI2548957.1 LON peptidase N-terminal domain and ring finger 1 [Homo sapiens]KAI4009594.1 LON peptidase N-terminal domain and ring finger 1 [Homo sapiens]KAI4009598.1 LON peptidase N-terminal domain and ring finger 1 [Homo sapiens]
MEESQSLNEPSPKQLDEPTDAEPVDTEGQLCWQKSFTCHSVGIKVKKYQRSLQSLSKEA